MNAEQAAMLSNLQQIGLTMDDLRIYLDTHLYDDYAVALFNKNARDYAALAREYSRRFEPLNATSEMPNDEEWAWGLGDFPWDF
ncbi:MAG: hypothetical protein GX572_05265 [Clostridia bacterium]|nr:hypothetical protein [Clostridia bacterium]